LARDIKAKTEKRLVSWYFLFLSAESESIWPFWKCLESKSTGHWNKQQFERQTQSDQRQQRGQVQLLLQMFYSLIAKNQIKLKFQIKRIIIFMIELKCSEIRFIFFQFYDLILQTNRRYSFTCIGCFILYWKFRFLLISYKKSLFFSLVLLNLKINLNIL
jgi:hypothetical protein